MLKYIAYVLIILASPEGAEHVDPMIYFKVFETQHECQQWVLQQQFVPVMPTQKDEIARGMWCEEYREV